MKSYYKKYISWLFLSSLFFILWSCNEGSNTANSLEQITAYSLNGVHGTIKGHSILVKIPPNMDKTKLKVVFKTNGASVRVGETRLISGETTLDFTKPVLHSVITADGNVTTYTVTVISLFVCVADGNDQCGCLFQNDGSGLMWYNSSLTNESSGYQFSDESHALTIFNSGYGHCGYNNWRVPTLSTLDNQNYYFGSYGNKISGTTDFGMLGNYAILNGYQSKGNLNNWLNSQGFNFSADSKFWSSSVYAPYPDGGAWMLDMTNGYVRAIAAHKGISLALLPVTNIPNASILSYSLNGVNGIIDGNSITVPMQFGTNVESLVATFTTSGVSVSVESTTQISGTTPNNFTNPVVYTVTAADGSSQNYTVTVTETSGITSFSLSGALPPTAPPNESWSGEINGNNISVWVAYCSDMSNLSATYATTGSNVTVGGVTQVNGQTSNNFLQPVTYVVNGPLNGYVYSYTVTVYCGY